MTIPSYKLLHIKSEQRQQIFEQLMTHQFGQEPYILSISHLLDQMEAIKNIEVFFLENKITHYPYPIYVISTINNYSGDLILVPSRTECPKFFDQKVKQLNVKENRILQKIYLKQKKLMNIKSTEHRPYLAEYAKSHRKLFEMQKEQDFYESLISQLENYYDKK